jgi:spermidine synthase
VNVADVRPPRSLGPAYAVSGACALVYQVVWTHLFTEELGASGTTFLVVLCAFIGGLGLGAVASDRVYRAVEIRLGGRGLRNYGRTELLVGLVSAALSLLTRLPVGRFLGAFPYRLRVVNGVTLYLPTFSYLALKLGLAVLAVGVPCFLMGLTFPYLCSLFPSDARLPSRLYAVNTFGASIAVLGTEFWGLGALGYLGCLGVATAGTLGLGIWFARVAPSPGAPRAADDAAFRAAGSPLSVYPAVLSGFLCGGVQTLAFVLLKLTLGPTRGAFALLAFFSILGIWIASTAVHRSPPTGRALKTAGWLGLAAAVAVWVRQPALSEALVRWGVGAAPFESPDAAAVAVSVLATGLMLFVPYTLWATLLPALCDRKQARGENLSVTYGANTLSFLAGVLVFGWALPYVNFFFAARVFAVAAAAGLLLLSVAPESGRPGRWFELAAGAVAVVLSASVVSRGPDMSKIGGQQGLGALPGVYRSTPQHFFWVREGPSSGSRSLMFDGHSMSGTGATGQIYMRTMAHLPLLLHPRPESVLLICFGVGVTADAIRTHSDVARVDVVDLNPDVFLLNRWFAAENGDVLSDPRFRLICDDGRQYLRLTRETYDFVTMEPPPPLQPGISRLYSREFYEAIRRRLAPGGLVSQWLPESQMGPDGVDLIMATFLRSFRHAFLFSGFGRDLILVGSDAPFDFGDAAARLSRHPVLRAALARLGFEDAPHLFATILGTEGSLRRSWGGGPVIRDGFRSLEALQVNAPVQRLHPRSTWTAPKERIAFDEPDVLETLRATAPDAAAEVERLWANPAPLTWSIPPWYFRRSVPSGDLATESAR